MGHYYSFKQILTLVFIFVNHGLSSIRNCRSSVVLPQTGFTLYASRKAEIYVNFKKKLCSIGSENLHFLRR